MGGDIHSLVQSSEKGCRIRVTHVHARSDCVHTRDDTDRLTYAFRFVRVIYSSRVVSIKLGTVTPPPSLRTGSTRTIGRSSLSGATRTRPGDAARTPPGGATRVSPGNATLFSAVFFETTTLSTSAWISFWRCRRCHPHASKRCLAGKRHSPLDRVDRESSPWAHPRDSWPDVSEVHVSITSPASDGASKFGVLRRFPISVIAASFIAGRRSHDGILQ